MTQLNLSGRQSNSTQQKPSGEYDDGSIKDQTVGALGALAMFVVVIVIASCSRSSKPVAVQQPIQPTAQVAGPAVTVPDTVPAPVAVPVKAKTKKHRAATLSYVNPEYGISLSFPRNYQLKTGKEMQAASETAETAQMDFVHPGGVTLADVKLPDNSYPGTDFKSGFLNVSVNPGMTSEDCTQFAFPDAPAGPSQAKTAPVKTSKVKIGGIEFDQVESSEAAAMKPTNAKYYHVFSNGACYEFALGIGTESDGNVEGTTPVDREQVFGKLEKILATVKLQPAVMPETATPSASAGGSAPADSSRPDSTSNPETVNNQNF